MAAPQTPHTSDAALSRMAARTAPHDEVEQVREHLDDCEACAEALLGLIRTRDGSPPPTEPGERIALPPGTRVGRFELVDVLGAGNMGTVFTARDPQLERQVAIKVLRAGRVDDRHATRLAREARAMAQIRHPNVVTVYEVGSDEDVVFVAMERIHGPTLRTEAWRNKPATKTVLGWLSQVAAGLAAVHAAGLVHRDVKPDNIFVETDASGAQRVVVGDFGLAASDTRAPSSSGGVVDRWSARELAATAVLGTVGAGTPAYMPPEQLLGDPLDRRADIFAFGVTAWELLVGERPFAGLTAVALEDAIRKGAPERELPVGKPLARAIAACLAYDRKDRPASLDELRALLAAAIDSHSPARRRRHLRVIAYVALAAAASALIAVSLVTRSYRAALADREVTARRLFAVPMRAALALSPDGERLAMIGDTLEVRELDGPGDWFGPDVAIAAEGIAFEADGVHVSDQLHTLYTWDYEHRAPPVAERKVDGSWYGRVGGADVIVRGYGASATLAVVQGGRDLASWPFPPNFAAFAVSPDNRHFAVLEGTRYGGAIDVFDSAGGPPVRSGPLVEPTAVAWLSADELLYATGTVTDPSVFRARVGRDRVEPGRLVYHLAEGWFIGLASKVGRTLLFDASPVTRVRLLQASGGGGRDFDASAIGAPLAWRPDGTALAWSRGNGALERITEGRLLPAPGSLDGEPANATLAGETLIVALRRNGGREVMALSLATGTVIWRLPVGAALTVRCAADLAPPCFALRAAPEPAYEAVPIDPQTGKSIGAPIAVGNDIEDLAISADGARILVGGHMRYVRMLDRSGALIATHATTLATVRSLAFEPRGASSVLIAGTRSRNTYELGRIALDADNGSTYAPLLESDGELLSLVRPSPDGANLLVLARALKGAVWQLEIPVASRL